MMYAQDNDEALPGAADNSAGAGVSGGWVFYDAFPFDADFVGVDVTQGSLYPYVKNTRVYVCPSDGAGRLSGDSYAINGCVTSSVRVGGLRAGRRLASFPNPASWILFCEEAHGDLRAGSTDDGYFDWENNTFAERHSGGQNVEFIDGHVRWYPVSDIVANQLVAGGGDPATLCPIKG